MEPVIGSKELFFISKNYIHKLLVLQESAGTDVRSNGSISNHNTRNGAQGSGSSCSLHISHPGVIIPESKKLKISLYIM